jgi:hypothetical protein
MLALKDELLATLLRRRGVWGTRRFLRAPGSPVHILHSSQPPSPLPRQVGKMLQRCDGRRGGMLAAVQDVVATSHTRCPQRSIHASQLPRRHRHCVLLVSPFFVVLVHPFFPIPSAPTKCSYLWSTPGFLEEIAVVSFWYRTSSWLHAGIVIACFRSGTLVSGIFPQFLLCFPSKLRLLV